MTALPLKIFAALGMAAASLCCQAQADAAKLPANKAWAELSPAQQAQFRNAYTGLPDGDEPPYPRDGMQALTEPVRFAANQLRVEGSLTLHLEINAEGEVRRVSVYKSPDAELSKAAASIAVQTAFKPARCAGKPCAMAFPWRVDLPKL